MIVHRDLKLQNILLATAYQDDESILLKVVDFGIFGSVRGSAEKVEAGSLRYMAPELLHGKFETTPKIDVWSMGVILHALLLGKLPFRQKDKEELQRSIKEKVLDLSGEPISEDAKDLVLQMLEKDPAKRISIIEMQEHPWLTSYKDEKFSGLFSEGKATTTTVESIV